MLTMERHVKAVLANQTSRPCTEKKWSVQLIAVSLEPQPIHGLCVTSRATAALISLT